MAPTKDATTAATTTLSSLQNKKASSSSSSSSTFWTRLKRKEGTQPTVNSLFFVRNELTRAKSKKKLKGSSDLDDVDVDHHDDHHAGHHVGHHGYGYDEKPQRWVDYFCILGLSASEQHKVTRLGSFDDNDTSTTSTKRLPCTPQLLDCYPQTRHDDMDVPQHLAAFCFPQGCSTIRRRNHPNHKKTHNIPDPTVCNLVLTLGTGHRLYVTTLTVYEKMRNPTTAAAAAAAAAAATSGAPAASEWWSEDAAVNEPPTPPPQEQEPRAKRAKANHDHPQDQQDDKGEYCYWIPKCLALLSHYPYLHAQSIVLKELYYTVASGSSPIPIERFIAHIVDGIPMPHTTSIVEWKSWTKHNPATVRLEPPSFLDIMATTTPKQVPKEEEEEEEEQQQQHLLRRPTSPSPIPFTVSLEPLFRTLSLSNILVLWATLLKEGKVVLSCHPKNTALLTPIAQALLELLFPLEWQGIYIPVLPTETGMELLDAPVPYLVGLTTTMTTATATTNTNAATTYHPRGVVWCDLDDDILHLGCNEDGSFVESLPVLPENAIMTLKVELEEVADPLYLPSMEGIKGKMTTGDRSLPLDNGLREPYALRTKLFDERHTSSQAFSRAYVLSQSSKVPPRGKPLKTEDFVVEMDPEVEHKTTGLCCFGIAGELTREPTAKTFEASSTIGNDLNDATLEFTGRDSTASNKTSTTTDFNASHNPFMKSFARSGRQMQVHTDRLLAVFGQKEYATPSVYASRASADQQFAEDALKRQDEIAAQFFEIADTEQSMVTHVRASFRDFFVTIGSRFDFYVDPQTNRLDVDRCVRSMRLPREHQGFVRTMLTTQMYDSFLQDTHRRQWLQDCIKDKSSNDKAVAPKDEKGDGVVVTTVPPPCGAGVSKGRTFCQDRRFPDEMNAKELIIERKQDKETLWTSLCETTLSSAMVCCIGHN